MRPWQHLIPRGITFTVISSRPPRGLRMLLDALRITRPFGAFNGGVIARPDLSVISEHLLSPAVARRAVGMLDAAGVQTWVYAGKDWVARDAHGPQVERERHTLGFGPTVVADFGSCLDIAAKVVGVSADTDFLAEREREIGAALAGEATVQRSQTYYLDITDPSANKGVGLADLSRLLAVPTAEIAVIGDGRNDVHMFRGGGLAIAMGNASADVKSAADAVTDSNGEDGFAKAVERFILQTAPLVSSEAR